MLEVRPHPFLLQQLAVGTRLALSCLGLLNGTAPALALALRGQGRFGTRRVGATTRCIGTLPLSARRRACFALPFTLALGRGTLRRCGAQTPALLRLACCRSGTLAFTLGGFR